MTPLPPPVQAVLELFQGPLAELRFADVDAAVLASSASAVEAAAAAVAEQEAQLSELRQTLADRQEALLLLAQRGLAYARVYAEHDDALTEQLARVSLPRANKPRKPSTKAVSAEPSAPGSKRSAPDAEPSEVAAEPSAIDAARSVEATTTFVPDESADPNPDTAEAPGAEEQPARKGKRRASAARDEAQSRPS